jgi:hypothetical protein
MFFSICLGLGYPSLNRFDPRATGGTTDSAYYAAIVQRPVPALSVSHRYFRVLIPLLARPFAAAARGRVGSWDPVMAGLLVSTSCFTAMTLVLLIAQAQQLGCSAMTGLLAAFCFVTNFEVANEFLVGMVDSAEACAVMLMYLALGSRRLWLLPVCGLIGGLGKETFVVIGSVSALTYWSSDALRHKADWPLLAALLVMTSFALVCVYGVHAWAAQHTLNPLSLISSFHSPRTLFEKTTRCIFSAQFWYGLFWLLPVALFGLRAISRSFVVASVAGVATVLVLGIYRDVGPGNVARPIFSYAGPLLAIAAARSLVRLSGSRA